jgi:Tubulin binding cofactor C
MTVMVCRAPRRRRGFLEIHISSVCSRSITSAFVREEDAQFPLPTRPVNCTKYSKLTRSHVFIVISMPPKPQVFKTPDGKEFNTRAEWRDYMMLTFYSFKDKKNEAAPLVKKPGEIDGQMFDIADCENSTLVIMDYCEQVQIDQVKNCRIFIGACASSIFIRNCENCTFYTSCRQLRLREVVNSTFYIYSMAEVHIEYSNAVKFAPFNGGYPEQLSHMNAAKLDPKYNLWYDIFDHNDPAKDGLNWSLLPEAEYEQPWWPAGAPCEPAVPRTKPGSVVRLDLDEAGVPSAGGEAMQSFSVQQLIADAKAANGGVDPNPPKPPSPQKAPTPAKPPAPTDKESILKVIAAYCTFQSPEDLAMVRFEVIFICT